MYNKDKYPIIEFDDNQDALINPAYIVPKVGKLDGNKLIISFFKEAINDLIKEGKIEIAKIINGENDLVIYKYIDSDIYLVHGALGCPACAGYLDDMIALGITKVMFCGGGGVLDKNIKVGELLVVSGAIRDEGFSYHYIKPSRIIESNKEVKQKITNYLSKKQIPYLEGLVWTTDAFYRETVERIKHRKEEGAKIVEMEQAGCLAVTQFRNIEYGAIIYGGDDVSSDAWDGRTWRSRKGIRYSLIELCKEIVNII